MATTEKTPPYEALGLRIRGARRRKGISQEDFAPLVGVTRRHLIRIEKGRHRPSDALLARIAEVTGQRIVEPQEAALSGGQFRGDSGSVLKGPAADVRAKRRPARNRRPVSEDAA